jgi:hypothetical protein
MLAGDATAGFDKDNKEDDNEGEDEIEEDG